METKEVQTMLRETNRAPMGAVIIQKEKEKKKKSKMQKKQIKSIPNATPSQEQQFRIFQNIDYPYLMRNVEIQEEDKMVKALKEVFGIKEKTPEMVADEAIEKSYGKSRSFPLYTDAELTQQELRARAINRSESLRKIAGVSGLFDDEDRDIPSAFNASVDNYMSYLADFRREMWGEEEAGAKTIKTSGGLSQEQLEAKMSAFNPSRQPYKEPSKAGRPRKPISVLEVGSLEGAKTREEIPSFITSEADLESLIDVMGSTGIDKKKEKLIRKTNKIARTLQEALRNKIASNTFKEALQAQERRQQFQLDLFAKEEERRIQDIKSEFKRRDIQKTFSEMFGDF